MIIMMSMNAYVIMAIILGYTLGYFCFSDVCKKKLKNECSERCHGGQWSIKNDILLMWLNKYGLKLVLKDLLSFTRCDRAAVYDSPQIHHPGYSFAYSAYGRDLISWATKSAFMNSNDWLIINTDITLLVINKINQWINSISKPPSTKSTANSLRISLIKKNAEPSRNSENSTLVLAS